MKPIFLIGYMGSGKSSVGKDLAEIMRLSFIDTDNYIEKKYQKSVPQLFEEMGEDGFRVLEHNTLLELLQLEDCVVATGGGLPCYYDNMALMNSVGRTVYLNVSVDELMHRLYYRGNKRPLIQYKSEEQMRTYIGRTLEERESFYRQAQIVFPADDSVAAAGRISQLLLY